MLSFRRYKAVTNKEFLDLKRNVLFFMMTILSPIIFYLLFAFGFPLEAKHVMLGVVDFDKTATSRDLIDSFETATDLFDVKFVGDNYASAEKLMAKGKLRTILVIPNDFAKDIKAGRQVEVQALIDGVYPNIANLIRANMDAIIAVSRVEILAKYLTTHPGIEGGGMTFTPINLTSSGWYNSAFKSADFILPAIIALVLIFFPPMVATISLAREKETGSILNMYCSSLRTTEYLLGKMTPYIIITYLNFLLFLVLTIFVFDVPMRGSLLVLCFAGFVYVVEVIGIGLLVAVLVKSQVAAILITFIGTVMPSFLYSGFMVPMSSMEKSAQIMGMMLPTTYFIDLCRKIMVKGVGFNHVRLNVLVLTIFCIVIYVLCIKLFKKRVG